TAVEPVHEMDRASPRPLEPVVEIYLPVLRLEQDWFELQRHNVAVLVVLDAIDFVRRHSFLELEVWRVADGALDGVATHDKVADVEKPQVVGTALQVERRAVVVGQRTGGPLRD